MVKTGKKNVVTWPKQMREEEDKKEEERNRLKAIKPSQKADKQTRTWSCPRNTRKRVVASRSTTTYTITA